MANEMYVYLGIDAFEEDPDEITALVGLSPTSVTRKGAQKDPSKLKAKSNSWQFRIDAKQSFDLEMLVVDLLRSFPDKTRLKNAIDKGFGQVVCVLYAYDTEPCIELSPSSLRQISELGCGFWLDFYPMPNGD